MHVVTHGHTPSPLSHCNPFESATIVRDTQNHPTVHPDTKAECFSNSTTEESFVKSFQIVAPHASLSLSGLYLADLIVIELEI